MKIKSYYEGYMLRDRHGIYSTNAHSKNDAHSNYQCMNYLISTKDKVKKIALCVNQLCHLVDLVRLIFTA